MEDRIKAFSDNATFYKQSNDFTAKFARHALSLSPSLSATSIVHDNTSRPGVVSFGIASQFSSSLGATPKNYATDLAAGMISLLKE